MDMGPIWKPMGYNVIEWPGHTCTHEYMNPIKTNSVAPKVTHGRY